MTHRRAKLTPFGRRILVQRIEEMGWVAARAAEALGVSRATAQKWLKRFREERTDGLEDRTSRPRRCPKQLPSRGDVPDHGGEGPPQAGPAPALLRTGLSTLNCVFRT